MKIKNKKPQLDGYVFVFSTCINEIVVPKLCNVVLCIRMEFSVCYIASTKVRVLCQFAG